MGKSNNRNSGGKNAGRTGNFTEQVVAKVNNVKSPARST